MSDRFAKTVRSKMMKNIRTAGTAPELVVRNVLISGGYECEANLKDLPGRPDIILRQENLAIFVHGCFWHRHSNCNKATLPKSNRKFWINKLSANVTRDARHRRALRKLGWRTITIWECQLASPNGVLRKFRRYLDPDRFPGQ